MAGDIGVNERVIILPTGGAAEFAAAVLPRERSRVRHIYGPRLVVADDAGAGAPTEGGATSRSVGDGVQAVSDETRRQLTPAEVLGVDAFLLRQSHDYAAAKAQRPHEGADWDSGVAATPACHDATVGRHEGVAATGAEARAEAPTSARLTGSVAVGIVIVEGPTADLKFSDAERTKVVAEVQNGLGWLASQSPEGVTWVYDIRVVTLSTQPGAANLSAEQKEALWRDPAMAQLGFGAGLGGVTAYVEGLRSRFNTNWGYCAFFTKYPIYHFAYASIGGPRIVMDYANDGWGPDNIDRVFAHETGHIFGAPDEYASIGCNCGGSWGFHGRPNLNCAGCAPNGGVDCLMKANTWAMCEHTPYHLGFPLIQQTYSGVWRAGSDPHYLWVNASWPSFQAKWQELSQQGLRLVDFEVTGSDTQRRYSGVWLPGTDAHYLWVGASWQRFRAKWEELSAAGLRLVALDVVPVGGPQAPPPSPVASRGEAQPGREMALVYAGRSSAAYAPGGQTAQDGYGGGELGQAGCRPQRSRDAQRMAREAG